MTTVLGRDLGQDAYDRFHDRLFRATLHKRTPGTRTPGHPAGGTNPTITDYVCDAFATGYRQRFVDGERVKKGDYRVVILRLSIGTLNNDGVAATLDLTTLTPDITTVLVAQQVGELGNLITVELIGDAGSSAGSYDETGTAARLHFQPGATTVAQLEALVAGSTLVAIQTHGAPATLQAGDVLSPTPLGGGVDASLNFDPTIVPGPGDQIDVPPPGQTIAKRATVILVETETEAQITLQVRGAPT